jgi:hypothetical protein
MHRPQGGNRIFRKQEGNGGKSTCVIQSKYGAGNSLFWIHSIEEWRVTAKNVKIIKGNNKAKLTNHVTQDMKKISSRTENNAYVSHTIGGHVNCKIFGTFLKVCKKYQYVYTSIHILEKYYLCKASKRRVHRVNIKDTFSHKIDTIFDE